jgi:hypothetical protein
MDCFPEISEKRRSDETAIRNVVCFGREVRIRLHDSRVIFASVMPEASLDTINFSIRPWGLRDSMVLRFEDVASASPVRHMDWETQRAISAAQAAGTFQIPNRLDSPRGLARAFGS